jgi:S-disulfanyl-L-cysteine oxidoreductase SoxD
MFIYKSGAAWMLPVLLTACATGTTEPGVATLGKGPGLGQPASAAEIALLDIAVLPSGAGLPAGSGDARTGAKVYVAKCQACHGEKGAGKPADALAGGIGSLASPSAVRTVGSYWRYATTLFDYTRRAMPTTAPRSLTNDEVYAVTAYVLHLNGIISEDHTLNAQTLPAVRMPNRDGFVDYSKVR